MIKSSLIISTYNWPQALELVLISVKCQHVLPIEVIIADDGSTNETKELIESFKADFPVPLIHVWHEDQGFNKSMILNKAIIKSKGDYIIQSDGDCILHASFVKDHLSFLKKNQYLFGSRVNIQANHLKRLFSEKQIKFNPFSKGIKKRTRALYFPFLNRFFNLQNNFSKKFRGCNTSFFKSDCIAVNGYNEDITGWGREDSELMLRLHNNGVKTRRLRYRGIVFHIWHTEKSKDRFELNDKIEQKVINESLTWCENGINKYII